MSTSYEINVRKDGEDMTWARYLDNELPIHQAAADQKSIQEYMVSLSLEDGTFMRVLDVGEGEAIVFLPMVTELNFVYAPQLEEFRSDYRVILYEPRLSRHTHFGLGDRAAEVVALLKALGLKSAHIVAWSDTGSVAYYLAKQHAEICRSVIFLGLADRYTFPKPIQLLVQLLADWPIEHLVPSWFLSWFLGRYLGGMQVKPRWVAQRAAQVPEISRLFKHSVLPNLLEHQPQKGEVTVASLVVCGDRDALVTIDQAKRMAGLLANTGEAVIIPGGEHFLGYVNATPVHKAMRAFYACLASQH